MKTKIIALIFAIIISLIIFGIYNYFYNKGQTEELNNISYID